MLLWLFLTLAAAAAPPSAAAPPPAALDGFVLWLGEDGTSDPGGRRAAALFVAACDQGHALSCSWRDWLTDPAAVHTPAVAACESGDPLACVVAGWTLPGRAQSVLMVESMPFYEQACDAGFLRGCSELGWMYRKAKEPDRARVLLERACAGGVGNACLGLGSFAETPEEWVPIYQRGCIDAASPDPHSCLWLAEAYRTGEGIEQDKNAAHGMIEVLCAQGMGRACNRLGQDFDGLRMREADDIGRAAVHYRQSCALGFDWGCANLGRVLVLGARGEEGVEEGMTLLHAACHEERKRPSCWTLAAVEMGARPRMENVAAAWDAAELGCRVEDGESCAWLGLARWAGVRSGSPDPHGARETWEHACEVGWSAESCLMLARLDQAEGRDPGPGLKRACDAGMDDACAPADAADEPPEPPEPLDPPAAFHSVASRNPVLVRWSWDAIARCSAGLDASCRDVLLTQLLGSGRGLSQDDIRPWRRAIEQGCREGQAASCRALVGAAQTDAERLLAAARGCGPEPAREDLCRTAGGLLEDARGLPAAGRDAGATALCRAGRGGWCKDAIKAADRDGRTEDARALAALGCQAKDAWSCKRQLRP